MYQNDFLAPQQQEKKPSPMGFHQWFRGACRFGLVASGSCSLALAARLVPMLMPVAVITAGGAAIGAIIYALWKRGDDSLYLALGLLSAAVGVALGSWDGIAIFLATTNSATLIAIAGVALSVLVAIFAERIFNRRSE
jgi:hypothetical protein